MKIPDLQPFSGTETWFAHPFTVVDLKGAVWNVVTDRAWIFAVKGRGRYPRWSGNMSQLNIMLGLIQSIPVDPRVIDTDTFKAWASSDKLGKVMDIVLDLERLEKLLSLFLTKNLQVWDASSMTKQPCLGLDQEGMKAFLMGQTLDTANVFDTINLSSPVEEAETTSPDDWFGFDIVMSLDE